MKKIRIGIIGAKSFPAYGGAASSIQSLVQNLGSEYDLSVYLHQADGNPPEIKHHYKAIVVNIPHFKRLNTLSYYLFSCFHALIYGKYDIIHVQHLYSGFIVPFLRLRFKVVTTVHGIIPDDDNKWNRLDKLVFKYIEKLSLRYSNAIVSVSKPQINYLTKYTDKKILYIPNGVRLINTSAISLNSKKKPALTFSAARIIKLKGCDLFLKALRHINYEQPVKIIGDMTQVPSYKKQIEDLATGLNITFKGLITHKDQLYDELLNSKYFIFPSTKEGLSNMLLEVASLKVPIICSDIEENRAVFNEDEVLYFQSGNVADLADKIAYALGHNGEMEERARLAFKKVERYYPWDKVAKEYIKLFSRINN